jgi:hypothetical protein
MSATMTYKLNGLGEAIPVDMVLHPFDIEMLKVPVACRKSHSQAFRPKTFLELFHERHKVSSISLDTSAVIGAWIFLAASLVRSKSSL